MTKFIPLAPFRKIIKSCGAERVSEEATIFLAEIVEKNAISLAEQAVILANINTRKTVKKDDMVNALKYFK